MRLLSVSKSSLCESASIVAEQSSRCKLSVEKNSNSCVNHTLNSHENPALRHKRYFNIATVQRRMDRAKAKLYEPSPNPCSCLQYAWQFPLLLDDNATPTIPHISSFTQLAPQGRPISLRFSPSGKEALVYCHRWCKGTSDCMDTPGYPSDSRW